MRLRRGALGGSFLSAASPGADPSAGEIEGAPAPGPILMVEVVNHSPDPDGSYKHYFLRVDSELRPILADGSFGAPQKLTARNAVASTFGLPRAGYAPDVQT